MTANTDNYDRIARFYDTDMALNMRFDDIGFYTACCVEAGGPVLELGCGNGRILLPLAARGVDVTGIDGSAAMLDELRRKAAARRLSPQLARMDTCALGFAAAFAVVLCPYSLITYVTSDDSVARLFDGVRRALRPGGVFVVDAFVPRPTVSTREFSRDYQRPWGDLTLARSKRIAALPNGHNRIERRYDVVAANGELLDRIEVAEEIRPRSPDDLVRELAAGGFATVESWWDYASREPTADAQFFTVVARVAPG
jgi:SAM-dependent methyltransferase